LEDRKGADEQNLVRRELKRVFPKRDCCTLIRPLTNEEDLQNLSEMDLGELRSDFVEQVVNLRRQVLNKLEPKKIGGSILDGPSLSVMAVKYVDAINTGAIPNIKSTWQYICLEKATKQVEKKIREFRSDIDSFVLPQDHFELEASIEEHIKDALHVLTKKSLANLEAQILLDAERDAQNKMRCLKEEKLQENLGMCKQAAQQMITQVFSELEAQLKQSGADKLDTLNLEHALQDIQHYYNENAYEFPEKQLMLSE